MGPQDMSETTFQTPAAPTGPATFVFTDIEGSTKLVQEIGTEPWRQVLEDHHRLLREQWQAFDGREVNTEGDAFFVAFPSATNAVAACAAAQQGLAAYAWPDGVNIKGRMGLHTGEAQGTEAADYLGIDVHRAARIAPGGTGKQRLSVQIAADIAGEFQGVYFVPLASIDDAELVPTTIARALGLQESGQKTPVEMIIENLASRKVLLVLDNFEQVIEAAPAGRGVPAPAPR